MTFRVNYAVQFLCVLVGWWAMQVYAIDFDDAANLLRKTEYEAAAVAFRTLATQGDIPAQAVIGTMYLLGQGVQQDDREAVFWLSKAAENGYAGAQSNLGNMYLLGRGVEKDPVAAVNWYRKAAMQGEAKAQHNLGLAYARGTGVEPDPVEASKWFYISKAGGYDGAGKAIDTLERRMDPAEISEARRRAVDWIKERQSENRLR